MRPYGTYIGVPLLAAGSTFLGVGAGHDGVFELSVGISAAVIGAVSVAVCQAVRVIRAGQAEHARPADEAYELGYQMGYDKGYCEGRRVARPVVVPLRACRCQEGSTDGVPATPRVRQVAGDRVPANRQAQDVHRSTQGRGA